MRNLRLLAVFLFAFLRALAVEEGTSLEDAITEKGEPSSRMQLGDTTILIYPDETIKVREGKVISVKAVGPQTENRTTVTTAPGEWTTSYASAMAQAKEGNRRVLLFFTGSDWCGWCKRLNAEVLSTAEFRAYAEKKLVLVKLDFPHQLPQTQQVQAQNSQLQQKYEIGGYPTIIILDSRGKYLGRLGYQEGGAKAYVNRLKRF